MTAATTMISIATAVIGAVGAMSQAAASSKAANTNAAIANNNAIASRQQAAEQEKRFRRTSAQRAGALRAGGASLDLLEDSAMQEELEALSIRHGGEINALGLENTAAQQRQVASDATTGGYFGAGSALIIGADKTHEVWGK